MGSKDSIRSLFKWLLGTYIITFAFIFYKTRDNNINKTVSISKIEKKSIDNRTEDMTKITHIIYVNQTKIVRKMKFEPQYGPGENGNEVLFRKEWFADDIIAKLNANKEAHGFNTFVSDAVALNRKIPDKRPKECREIAYPDTLPAASIVIIFRDEWPSILLRTAYSVLEMTPPELIKEVILVDDGSLNKDLKTKVDIHVATMEKFKLVRNNVSLGLMLARQKGIEAATADYFVTMDGHMEVGPGWLEPLLYRLIQEPNALLCSHVGSIGPETFQTMIIERFETFFPFFDHLSMEEIWVTYSDTYLRKRGNSMVKPIPYAMIQGMMTVMRKDFFMQLGGFDPGMQIWGSEQIELSVKVWLCGGRVEMIPCSKVYHMYRKTPWGGLKTKSDYHSVNKARVVEVWMDGHYQEQLRDYLKDKNYEPGDLQSRHKIRTENNCKPYQYFIDKVKEFSDVFLPDDLKARGRVYNKHRNKCIDYASDNNRVRIILYPCHEQIPGNQYFVLTNHSQIRSVKGTLLNAVKRGNITSKISLKQSTRNVYDLDTLWTYTMDDTIQHKASEKCMTAGGGEELRLLECSGNSDQKWQWNRLL